MKSRALAFALAAAFLLFAPASIQADKFKPPVAAGILTEDSTCPAATHVLSYVCFPDRPNTYVVFRHVKGPKRFLGGYVTVSGPVDTTSCPLPLMNVEKIGPIRVPPPPCG